MNNNALWTAEEASAATGGRNSADWQATGVSIDSRTISPGDLFVALRGPNFDGHNFVAGALAKGAAAALVADDYQSNSGPLLRVNDTMAGLEHLARAARGRNRGRLIAVTGSVGKTGTKEALRTVLAEQNSVHASEGSLNNQWGVPLSLARMPKDAAYGVFELGMNHPGEIAPLIAQVRPQVALITNVENVHAEFFSSEEEIADAKAEIFTGLAHEGTAILNRDNRQFARLDVAAKTAGVGRVLTFGVHEDADARLVTHVTHAECVCVAAKLNGEDVRYKVGAPGKHWAMNSLAVLLAAKTLGADPGLAAIAMAKVRPPKGRGQRHVVHLDGLSFDLIDESYNASPIAVRAALAVLGESQVGARGRRIAVLGDMLELGEQTAALHGDLADAVVASEADMVFTCGSAMKILHENLPNNLQTYHADDSAGLVGPLLETIAAGDVVMVKGSLGSRMQTIVDALLTLGRSRCYAVNGR